jgi:hypothetical protein
VTGAIARYLASRPDAATDVAALLQAAGSLDWQTSTDPRVGSDADATPLRLVDAGALLSTTPGLRAWARRSVVTVGEGVTRRSIRLEFQRAGGLAAGVGLSVDGLPSGVRVADGPSIAGIRGDLVLDVDGSAAEGDHRLVLHAVGGGAASDVALTLRIDREAPDVASARLRVTLGTGGTFDGKAKVRVAWSATDLGSGVARTELQRRSGGVWVRAARATGSGSVALSLGTGSSARFRIVARDRVGNSATSTALSTRLLVRDSSGSRVTWTGPWKTRHISSASGRSVRTSRGAGAQASLRFTGRAVAVVAPRGPGRGRIDVTIDGVRVGSASLSASRTQQRRVVFASGALSEGEHLITVRTRKAGAELDAILVLE